MQAIASPYLAEYKNRTKPQRKFSLLSGLLLIAACLLCIDVAYADCVTIGGQEGCFVFFNQFDNQAKETGTGWLTTIRDLGRNTFFILATIELAWAAAIWAIEKDNLNALATEMIQKIMFIGFFLALLNNAPQWIPMIIDSFRQTGVQATGSAPPTVDSIIATGFAIVNYIWNGLAGMGILQILMKFPEILVAVLVTIFVIVAYVIGAAQLLCLNIESYVILAAGAIFLGLGSSRWTNEYVTKYLTYALTVGVRLLTLLLILGLTTALVNRLAVGNEKFVFEFAPLFRMLAMAVVTGLLAVKAPEMAMALMQGGVGFSGGSAQSAASSVSSVAAAPFNLAGSAISKAASASQGAYHTVKAMRNSTKLARLEGKSGHAARWQGALTGGGLILKEGARSAFNALTGKKHGSEGFSVSRYADKKDKKERQHQQNEDGSFGAKKNMGEGLAQKPGAMDRANREVKQRIALLEAKKKGGTIEGKGGDASKAEKPSSLSDANKASGGDKKSTGGQTDNKNSSSSSSHSKTSSTSSSGSSSSTPEKGGKGVSSSSSRTSTTETKTGTEK